jgi:hypothetical protein
MTANLKKFLEKHQTLSYDFKRFAENLSLKEFLEKCDNSGWILHLFKISGQDEKLIEKVKSKYIELFIQLLENDFDFKELNLEYYQEHLKRYKRIDSQAAVLAHYFLNSLNKSLFVGELENSLQYHDAYFRAIANTMGPDMESLRSAAKLYEAAHHKYSATFIQHILDLHREEFFNLKYIFYNFSQFKYFCYNRKDICNYGRKEIEDMGEKEYQLKSLKEQIKLRRSSDFLGVENETKAMEDNCKQIESKLEEAVSIYQSSLLDKQKLQFFADQFFYKVINKKYSEYLNGDMCREMLPIELWDQSKLN